MNVKAVVERLLTAKRPLLHIGRGVRLAHATRHLIKFIDQTQIPVVTARNANDLIDSSAPWFIGRPGTFGNRGANFAIQSCDLCIALGTRLSLAQTGYDGKDYCRNGVVIHVNIDKAELQKASIENIETIRADADEFLVMLLAQLPRNLPDWTGWMKRCQELRDKYPPVTQEMREQRGSVNSYHLIDELSNQLTENDVIVTDMGFAFQCTHQAFRVKVGQKLMTNCGLAPMGWGLPAAVGASIGSGRRTVCITGDGGMMMNIQELATIRHHNLPIKIFLLNNGGYLTMKQSMQHAFGHYMGSDKKTGLSFPNWRRIAKAHNIAFLRVKDALALKGIVAATLTKRDPVLCEVVMDVDQPLVSRAINKRDADGNLKQTALEDAWPYLPAQEIEEALAV